MDMGISNDSFCLSFSFVEHHIDFPEFSAVTLQHYDINVYERMLIRLHTLVYVRGTLGIRRVCSTYADIHRCTLCYTQRQSHALDIFKIERTYEHTLTYVDVVRSSVPAH